MLAGWLASCLVLTSVRTWGPEQHLAVLVASFASYAAPAYALLVLLLLVVLVRARRRLLPAVALVVALVGLTMHVAWLAPSFVAADVPDGGDEVVVATLNQRFGRAETDAVVRWLGRHDPDVVVLTETTPESLEALEADPRVGPAGEGPWPFRAGEARPQAAGTVVLSQHRLGTATEVPIGNGGFRMRVGTPTPFVLTAAHAAYPLQSEVRWAEDLRTLRDDAVAVRDAGERHVTVGDLNATLDHRQLRDVMAAGLGDAVDQAGSGWQPTWPTPGEPTALDATLPVPLIAIDHVLVSEGIVATSTATDVVPGADHLGLVARLVVGPGPGDSGPAGS